MVFGCSEGVLTGVSPPPGLAEPSLELLSFLRCSRFSLLLTLVSHVPEKKPLSTVWNFLQNTAKLHHGISVERPYGLGNIKETL